MTSGQQMLFGSVGSPILEFGGTIASRDIASPPYSADARVSIASDGSVGTVQVPATGEDSVGPRWLSGTTGSDWYVRASLDAGTTPTTNAGIGSWLQLNVTRTWGNATTIQELRSSTLTFDFARTPGGTIEGSSTVVVEAEIEY